MKRSGPAPNAESLSLASDTCRWTQTEQLADALACESSRIALVHFFQTLDRWACEADAKAKGLANNPTVAGASRPEAAAWPPYMTLRGGEKRGKRKLVNNTTAELPEECARPEPLQSNCGM